MSRHRILAALVATLVLGGCAAAGQAPDAPGAAGAQRAGAPGPIRNADFEDDPLPGRPCPPSWWCMMHANTKAYDFSLATGDSARGRYLKVRQVKEEFWAMSMQTIPAAGLAERLVRLSVAVNTTGLVNGGAGPMLVAQGDGGRVLGQGKSLVAPGTGWRRASVELKVPAGTQMVEIGLRMEGGGWAGFDEVQVEIAPEGNRQGGG